MALPKKNRLSYPHRLQVVSKSRSGFLEARLFEGEENKAAVVVPKSVVKKAVDRNRIRRQCHGNIYQHFKKDVVGPILIRVVGFPKSQQTVAAELSRCIEQLR